MQVHESHALGIGYAEVAVLVIVVAVTLSARSWSMFQGLAANAKQCRKFAF